MDQLDADSVPFPLGGIIVERDLGLFERVGEHERAEHRHVAHGRLLGAALRPVEQLGERRPQAVPHLLDRLDLEPERVGQRLLGEPRADPDPKRAGRELEQREAARRIEMVEHRGERARRIQPGRRAQPLDRLGDADRGVVDLGRLADRLGPQQRHRLGHVADIVAAHVEQHRIDPLLGDRANRGALDRRNVERSGQRGEAIAAVRVGRFPEIIADQLELGVARARVDEVVEQLREGAHRAFNARTGARVSVQADGERGEDRRAVVGSSGCRALRRHARGRTASRPGGRAAARAAPSSGRGLRARQGRGGGELADRVHPRVKIERREARPASRISATRSPTSFLTVASGSVAIARPPVERRFAQSR